MIEENLRYVHFAHFCSDDRHDGIAASIFIGKNVEILPVFRSTQKGRTEAIDCKILSAQRFVSNTQTLGRQERRQFT